MSQSASGWRLTAYARRVISRVAIAVDIALAAIALDRIVTGHASAGFVIVIVCATVSLTSALMFLGSQKREKP